MSRLCAKLAWQESAGNSLWLMMNVASSPILRLHNNAWYVGKLVHKHHNKLTANTWLEGTRKKNIRGAIMNNNVQMPHTSQGSVEENRRKSIACSDIQQTKTKCW